MLMFKIIQNSPLQKKKRGGILRIANPDLLEGRKKSIKKHAASGTS